MRNNFVSSEQWYKEACNLELEHIEICFKPKEKYLKAFETLQRLFPLIKGTREERYEKYIEGEGVMHVDESYFNAINLETGELNMLRFVLYLGGELSEQSIHMYVKDDDLKSELFKAITEVEQCGGMTKGDEYLWHLMIPTVERNNLVEYILDKKGNTHIILNIMELNEKGDSGELGRLLGTFAQEVTRVVHIDSRAMATEESTMDNRSRKFERLMFNFNHSKNELSIMDVRVAKKDAFIKYVFGEICCADDVVERDIDIRLIDMDNRYTVRAEINIKDEYQFFVNKMARIAEAAINAHEDGTISLNKFAGYACDDKFYAEKMMFEILNSDFDITKRLVDESGIYFSMRMENRNYELEEAFREFDDDEVFEVLTSKPEEDWGCNSGTEFDFDQEEVIGCIEHIQFNQVVNEGKQWKFEGEFKFVSELSLKRFFNSIMQNIGKDDEPGYIDFVRM